MPEEDSQVELDRLPARGGLKMLRGRPWQRYLQGLLLVVAATLLSDLAHHFFSPTNLVMIYLLVVVVAAVYLGRGPAILVATLSVLAFDFFFVPPRLTLAVSQAEYLLTFVALFIVGLVISNLTALTREQAEAAEHRAAQTAELYALSRDLAVAASLEEMVQAILVHVSQTFGRQAIVFLHEGGTLSPRASSPGSTVHDSELAVALWAFQQGREAGRGTDTYPSASARYLPLKTAHGVVGVLGVERANTASPLTSEQRQLLETFASQAALALERAQLAEQARQAEVLRETEKLQTALLNSISHDLRTPLVSVVGALSSLQEDDEDALYQADPANRRSLVDNALAEAERLNRLVGNLLDMTRIEAGALKVKRELCDVEDLIGAALERLERRLGQRPVMIDVPTDMPLVAMDFVLMEQVLLNLLDNALKYSPPEAPIEVRARAVGMEAHVEIADRGFGIPAEDLNRVFDKFYRVQQPVNVSGTGLGLAICKGIVEAHGGRIELENRAGGGTLVSIALPLPVRGEVSR
jgi:two-component system sensor histidine kinase KdpD